VERGNSPGDMGGLETLRFRERNSRGAANGGEKIDDTPGPREGEEIQAIPFTMTHRAKDPGRGKGGN